ncbi:DUF862-domain-containing protein [Trametopsis cervina]|nr:DUF862-domain-containing protein [Trametopsis cervina]
MSKVQLYVYDLSNGLARQLSRQLTGRQIDGIWHTSVVVFGKEIFYGQGISITPPGQSHHGRPLQVIDMGQTAIDETTFQEFLDEMRDHYTADKVNFNCNSFTNDCIGLLTGGSIPDWIKDLPSDFLSTPFGASLRPTIDAMYRRPVPGAQPAAPGIPPQAAAAAAAASPNPALASSLLQAVASQAFSSQGTSASTSSFSPSGTATPSTETVSAPIHICTNQASFNNVLKTHRAVIALFTSPQTCAPCRVIAPVFERIARERTQQAENGGGIAFVKVDLDTGLASALAGEYSVRVTPTFLFFKDGTKTNELKGANAAELESQVKFLIWETYPPHPHTQKSLPALDGVSTSPILFTQVPALDTVVAKLLSFVDKSSLAPNVSQVAKQRLTSEVVPFLKTRFPTPAPPKALKKPAASEQLLRNWVETTRQLCGALPPAELFPLVDMWRLAVLDETVASFCVANAGNTSDPVQVLLVQGLANISHATPARNYTLTLLRLLSNVFASPTLGSAVVRRKALTTILVNNLLHEDAAVRTAAASLGFNIAAFVQGERLEQVKQNYGPFAKSEEDGDWEVEIVSAVLEALGNEKQSEEIVHRLVACLAFLLRFSPVHETQVKPLLDVLQAKDTVKSKLDSKGFSPEGVKGPALRKLITEVADQLC